MWIIIACSVLLAATAGALTTLAFVGGRPAAMYGYCVTVSFEVMPENDRALEEWLAAQPGVSGGVSTRRKGTQLTIEFEQTRSLGGSPPAPDIPTQFGLLGYRGVIVPLQDCAARESDES